MIQTNVGPIRKQTMPFVYSFSLFYLTGTSSTDPQILYVAVDFYSLSLSTPKENVQVWDLSTRRATDTSPRTEITKES